MEHRKKRKTRISKLKLGFIFSLKSLKTLKLGKAKAFWAGATSETLHQLLKKHYLS